MDAFVCFGTYGAERLETLAGPDAPRLVSWLPTTIPSGTLPRYPKDLAAALEPSDPRPLGSLYGYAAPWKDTENLIAACKRTKEPGRMIVAGPFWDDPSQAGLDLAAEVKGTTHGSTQLRVVSTYLNAAARLALVTATDFGIFPYHAQPTFQGSGAIADYLAHGVPALATDVANMAELIGDAGVVMESANPQSFADAVDHFIHDVQHRRTLTGTAGVWPRRPQVRAFGGCSAPFARRPRLPPPRGDRGLVTLDRPMRGHLHRRAQLVQHVRHATQPNVRSGCSGNSAASIVTATAIVSVLVLLGATSGGRRDENRDRAGWHRWDREGARLGLPYVGGIASW